MTEMSYLQGKVFKRSLPVFQGTPPVGALGLKRLALAQGELANFYDGQEGIRYLAYIELRAGTVRGNHWHRVKEEQIYVISGELRLIVQERESGERVSIQLQPGDVVLIAPGVVHALETVASGQAIEFSKTRFDPADIQRLQLV